MNAGKLVLAAALAALALGGCRRESAAIPPKAVAIREDGAIALNLMSFNIRYENADDRGSHAWRQRLAGAVAMIRREAPDVIGVQEALHGPAADLWASLPDYDFYGVGRDDGLRSGEYSGVFFKRDRFRPDPADRGTFWLSATPSAPGSRSWGNEIPRVAAWIRLIDRATGRGFYVFDTHWDHRSQESREHAALLLAEKIDGRARPDEPVALLGDFNSLEVNPAIRYLRGEQVTMAGGRHRWENGLLDAFDALHPRRQDRRTAHFWREGGDGSFKIDYVLLSPGAEVLEAGIVTADEPPVSDHYPVTARVLFPADG